jgi:hypothetical protein
LGIITSVVLPVLAVLSLTKEAVAEEKENNQSFISVFYGGSAPDHLGWGNIYTKRYADYIASVRFGYGWNWDKFFLGVEIPVSFYKFKSEKEDNAWFLGLGLTGNYDFLRIQKVKIGLHLSVDFGYLSASPDKKLIDKDSLPTNLRYGIGVSFPYGDKYVITILPEFSHTSALFYTDDAGVNFLGISARLAW